MLAEPIGIVAECLKADPWYTAIFVVFEPSYTSVTPRSISSSSKAAKAEAIG